MDNVVDRPTKIDTVTAEREFDKWADSWCLETIDDSEDGADNDEPTKAFFKNKKTVIGAIETGSLVFDDDKLVFTSSENKKLSFSEPTGAALMELDQGKENQNIGKLYKLMGACAGLPSSTFSVMKFRDLKVCLAVTNLFMIA